jgi:hypothetical protein
VRRAESEKFWIRYVKKSGNVTVASNPDANNKVLTTCTSRACEAGLQSLMMFGATVLAHRVSRERSLSESTECSAATESLEMRKRRCI